MSQNIPFEITALILGKVLRHNPGTFVVFCQINVVSSLESWEYNTFSSALEKYVECQNRGGSSVIYTRSGDRFRWLSPYLHTTFGNFIGNVHAFLGI